MNRRRFLKQSGAAAGLTAIHGLKGATESVSIITNPRDPIASTPPPAWAIRELQAALHAQGVSSKVIRASTLPAATGTSWLPGE